MVCIRGESEVNPGNTVLQCKVYYGKDHEVGQ